MQYEVPDRKFKINLKYKKKAGNNTSVKHTTLVRYVTGEVGPEPTPWKDGATPACKAIFYTQQCNNQLQG